MPIRVLRFSTLVTALGLFGPQDLCRAQGFVEHLEPPALERGKTTRVTVVGAGLGKALGLWTSLPAGLVKANPVGESSPTRAVLDVTVATDAPAGICGLRLATADGLANVVLCLIDDLPVTAAPKADGTPARVALPVALWGRFREAAVDRFAVNVSAGQRVSFEAVANRLGKDVDPLLTIRDAAGSLVAEHDNDPGQYFDFRFEHTFAVPGTYTVAIRDSRFHGSEHGLYVLRMGRFPAASVALPPAVHPGRRAELKLPELGSTVVPFQAPKQAAGLFFGTLRRPGDEGSTWLPLETADAEIIVHQETDKSIEKATPAKVPSTLCGLLHKPGERHVFRVDLDKGQKIQVRAESRAFNSPADLELAITDAKGKELRRVTENPKEEVVLDFNAGNGGMFGLTVRDLNRDGGPQFAYRLEVRASQPQVQISADVEGLTVPRGSYQPVPLTVTRSDYPGPISLSLVGAPPGLTLTPATIEAGVNNVVCKLAAAPDAPLGPATAQIVAELLPSGPPILVRTRPLIDRQIINVDLIPYGLREDQRRLPPALTDRLALQVTPPAPFTIELPEQLVTLGRYQHVDFPIMTTRTSDFTGPITFSAKGGQIAPKEEGRTRVYAEFAEATPQRLQAMGTIHSKILTNLAKHRVDVTAVGNVNERRVTLTRTFDLEVRSAFAVTADPAALKLEPGAAAKVRLSADRLKTFDGPVTVQLSSSQALNLPEKVVFSPGQAALDLEIKVEPTRMPGRQTINLSASGVVNGFEEEQRGGRLEIDVVKTPAAKK